jgi:hypothetical protein
VLASLGPVSSSRDTDCELNLISPSYSDLVQSVLRVRHVVCGVKIQKERSWPVIKKFVECSMVVCVKFV